MREPKRYAKGTKLFWAEPPRDAGIFGGQVGGLWGVVSAYEKDVLIVHTGGQCYDNDSRHMAIAGYHYGTAQEVGRLLRQKAQWLDEHGHDELLPEGQ